MFSNYIEKLEEIKSTLCDFSVLTEGQSSKNKDPSKDDLLGDILIELYAILDYIDDIITLTRSLYNMK